MKNSFKHIIVFSLILVIASEISCKKLVTVEAPPTSVSQDNVYKSNATASSVVTDLYAVMSGNGMTSAGAISSLSLFAGLSADELQSYTAQSSSSLFYFRNALTAHVPDNYWGPLYTQIFTCNSAIEGITKSNTLDKKLKQQLLGEALFMRAFHYFYLANLYGDVPLVLSTEYARNRSLSRSAKVAVYQQIVVDLLAAQPLLSSDYLAADCITPTADRFRPTKGAANTLLARTYLYLSDYAEAEKFSSLVIGDGKYTIESLDNVFLNTTQEVIWSLQQVITGFNTQDARTFVMTGSGPNLSRPVYLSDFLFNAFESGDLRKSSWVTNVNVGSTTYHCPFKYKVSAYNQPVTESTVVFRLAELYLIRAESLAYEGKLSEATADLNVIRNRAGLDNYSGTFDKGSIIEAIQHEKQVELFTEWGHRWLDLKRTGKVDQVMNTVALSKGGTWNSNAQLYPLPATDIVRDPNLVQNLGY